ncbi:MAG: YqjK-like family protein [Burkholderiaceae bacterium]|jgi:hypothetical protein|nr:YqjK-like family protein [Burkholderiaceae bacterium]
MSAAKDLLAQREQLKLRSAQLRERIAQRTQVLRPALRLADHVRVGASWAREHPEWLVLAGTAALGVLATRPKRALALGLRIWSGWQLIQRLRPVLGSWLRRS